MKHRMVLAQLVLFFSWPVAAAQVEPGEAETPTASETLSVALERLDQGDVLLHGKVTRIEPEAGMGGGAVIMIGGAGAGGAPFSGPIEILRSAGRDTVIVSREALPGFALFDDGDRILTAATYEEEPLDLGPVTQDLSGLLDLAAVRKSLAKVDLAVEQDQETGATTLSCELPKRLIRGASGMAAFMAPQVLRIEAAFRLDGAALLTGLTLRVVRSDPMADMRDKALTGELESGAVDMGAMPEPSDREGATTVYELEVSRDKPAPRTEKARGAFLEILENEEL